MFLLNINLTKNVYISLLLFRYYIPTFLLISIVVPFWLFLWFLFRLCCNCLFCSWQTCWICKYKIL